VLDAVSDRAPRVARLLWALDRGSYPRPSAQVRQALGRRLVLEHVETYSVRHRYLLCVGVRRKGLRRLDQARCLLRPHGNGQKRATNPERHPALDQPAFESHDSF
jgi:hypothetical protein